MVVWCSLQSRSLCKVTANSTSLSLLQEFFSDRNDTSLFMFGSHNKKRPHNLVIGRLFDHHVLDMVELGINSFKAIHDFTTSKCVLGSKPCFVFSGDAFETEQDYIRLKNLFIGTNATGTVLLLNINMTSLFQISSVDQM